MASTRRRTQHIDAGHNEVTPATLSDNQTSDKPLTVRCDYCHEPAEFVTGECVYPHRRDLWHREFYICVPCEAWVGCHKGTNRPLGRLANAELRLAKMAAHGVFDPFWKARGWKRGRAYAWLSQELGIDRSACHIGMFDVLRCRRVVEIVRAQK